MNKEKPSSLKIASQLTSRKYTRWHRLTIISSLAIALVIIYQLLPSDIQTQLIHRMRSRSAFMGPLLLFSLMALSLLWTTGQKIDCWIFQSINIRGYQAAWLDSFMNAVTQIGNGVMVLIASIFLFMLKYHFLAIGLITGVLSLGIFVDAIKNLTRRDRPFKQLENARTVGYLERGMSFPSGHTAQAFFLASFFSQYFQLGVGFNSMFYLIAIITGYSRLYIGMHYPRDVLGGAALGIIWGSLFAVAAL